MPSTLSPNMSLILPTVGQEPGPNWALDLNSSLSLVDQHDHSAGSGVQITPSGININTDLSFGSNNAITLRSVRLNSQIVPLALGTDINCIYVSNGNLFYNDNVGNQVQITASGAVNGTPGSIGNLIAPAAVTYVPGTQTFVFESNQGNATPGSLDAGNLYLRNIVPGGNYIQIQPNAVLPSSYSITLPSTLPAAQAVVEMSNVGGMSFNTTLYQSFNPTGAIILFAGTAAPAGWLFCDGSVVSQATYANLFTTIGTAFNTGGEGAGNFRLPDFRRRVPVGSGGTGSATLGNAVGNSGGAESVTLTTAEMPSHTHTDSGHIHPNTTYPASGAGTFIANSSAFFPPSSNVNTGTGYANLQNTGGGGAHNNIQPSLVVNYIIKA